MVMSELKGTPRATYVSGKRIYGPSCPVSKILCLLVLRESSLQGLISGL